MVSKKKGGNEMSFRKDFIFTSESVGEGHPDKICDQISDGVLDAALTLDPKSRVACEVYTTTGMVLIGGEITTEGYIDFRKVAMKVLKDIGYNNPEYGIAYDSAAILSTVNEQSQDIAMGVNESEGHAQGAGDQGMMFGYARKDTPELMPAPIQFAHQIMRKATEVRKSKLIPFLRPDAKCQVTVEYRGGRPFHINTVVLSHQTDDVPHAEIEKRLIAEVIRPALPSNLLSDKTRYLINPTGRFVIGGPQGDAGLTGRKIIVDTYGGMGRHGGGAFSGKDPSKVDRSAAYAARWVAKTIVAAGYAEECEVQIAYAIGIAEPVSLYVTTFDTGTVDETVLEKAVREVFDLTPRGIITSLDLLRPIYQQTATYGPVSYTHLTLPTKA
jgi:S-adenosylmethionine synthetase